MTSMAVLGKQKKKENKKASGIEMHDHFGRCYINTIGLFSAFTFLRLYLLIHSIRL